jgi:hypothetical protein
LRSTWCLRTTTARTTTTRLVFSRGCFGWLPCCWVSLGLQDTAHTQHTRALHNTTHNTTRNTKQGQDFTFAATGGPTLDEWLDGAADRAAKAEAEEAAAAEEAARAVAREAREAALRGDEEAARKILDGGWAAGVG